MTNKTNYEQAKAKLLGDKTVCNSNREVFREFFAYEEYKLQRQNDLRELDGPCYKTLYEYTVRLRTVNRWFQNKPWKDLTREDIQRVYDALEDGRIVTRLGQPFSSTQHYYNKIMKSKPFAIAGKAQLVREVIQFPKRRRRQVRYISAEGFQALVSTLSKPRHLLLFWLAWDIGENICALLQLQKKDFTRAVDPHTKEPEYRVTLSETKIKRSRQPRTEPTLYPETTRYCDLVLAKLADDDLVFPFGYRQAVKVLQSAARRSGVTCMPDGDRMRWKDMRSGMACHLLAMGWQPHEINLRLGHTPNSDTLNDYINYLAVDHHRPKRKMYESALQMLQERLVDAEQRERLARRRTLQRLDADEGVRSENELLRAELSETQARLKKLAEIVERLATSYDPGLVKAPSDRPPGERSKVTAQPPRQTPESALGFRGFGSSPS